METPSSPSQEEIEDFIQRTSSPAGKRYWVQEKRVIMFKIFHSEILDNSLPITAEKVKEAIAQLEEVSEARIRAFVYRARKNMLNKSNVNAAESPVPSTSSKTKSSEKTKTTPRRSSEKKTTPRRYYWTPENRRIIYKIFKKEILDVDSHIDVEKVNRALDELGETHTRKNIKKVKSFIFRIRKERLVKIENGREVTPISSDTEGGADGTTDSPDGVPLHNGSDNDSGTVEQDASVNDQKETEAVSDLESLIDSCTNPMNVSEEKGDSVADESKLDSGAHTSKEENLGHENNVSLPENADEKAKSDSILESFIKTRSKSENAKIELENGQGERKCYPPANSLKRKSMKLESSGDSMEHQETSVSDEVDQSFNKNSDSSKVEESKLVNDLEEAKLDSVAESLIENHLNSENVNKGASENNQIETNVEPDEQSSDETAAENLENEKQFPEIYEEEMKYDPVALLSSENGADPVTNHDIPENIEEAMEIDCGTETSIKNDMVSENNDSTAVVHQDEAKLGSALQSPSEDNAHSMINETVPENCSEETKCDPVVPPSNETCTETENANGDKSRAGAEEMKSESVVLSCNDIMDSENTTDDSSKNEAEEMKLDSGIQLSNENHTDCENIKNEGLENDETTATEFLNANYLDFKNITVDPLENGGNETESNPVEQSLEESRMDCENDEKAPVNRKRKSSSTNDEVSVIPKKKKTQWTTEMISVMKNHFARELSVETDKVDFIANFLKSNGFDGITNETVFAWANNQLNDSSELFSAEVIECLVGGVTNGDVDLQSISKSNLELNVLPQSSLNELNAEKLNGANDLPSEQLSSMESAEENILDNLGVIELPPNEQKVADEENADL